MSFANGRLRGEKSGKRIGKTLNIVANVVEEINETDKPSISTSTISRTTNF